MFRLLLLHPLVLLWNLQLHRLEGFHQDVHRGWGGGVLRGNSRGGGGEGGGESGGGGNYGRGGEEGGGGRLAGWTATANV